MRTRDKLKPDQVKRWTKSLRSGRFIQGEGYLRAENEDEDSDIPFCHCCLGVLAQEMGDLDIEGNFTRASPGWSPNETFLTSNKSAFYISAELQEELAEMNDQGNSFEEIADHIEERLL